MLQKTIDHLVYSILGLEPSSRLGGVLNFFLYDSVKILFLLFFMISLIGFLRSYISQRRVKEWINRKKVFGYFFASLFGATTPFCSCSSIPIFLSFLKTGIPLGVTFTFLITSPLINEYLVILMFGFFGWKITVLYVISGMCIGVVSGVLLAKMKLEKYLVQDMLAPDNEVSRERMFRSIKERIIFGIGEALAIIRRLWIWILIGVGIGAVIHNFVPRETIQTAIDRAGVFSVPIAVVLGVPMYGSCAAIVPIAVALFRKGVPLGTALAFMMAVSALSLPEAVILQRAMKLKLIIIFFVIVTAGIVFTGYIFNALAALTM